MFRVLTHASEVLTGAGIRQKNGRHPLELDLGRIEDGALVYQCRKLRGREIPGKIEWVGPTSQLPKKYLRSARKNLRGKSAVIPGLIDCHTHLVFAGDRADEFADRCGGATYQEIAARGGGIQTSVRATRKASRAELVKLASERVKEFVARGVRTLEIKSGYGLSHADEIRILEAAQDLKRLFPELTFSITFLGAHAFPRDMSPDDYVEEIVNRTLPEVARRKLADSCDAFVDQGYFSVQQGRRILGKAKELGLKIKLHADELADLGVAELAVEMGALSADHLLRVSKQGIARLAASDTVSVLLPGTAFYLKLPHAPARELIRSGARVALSTDFNPGTSMTTSLPAIMTLAALYLGMTRSEIFAAVTFNAAEALGLGARKGTLEAGMDADIAVLPFARFEDLYYRFGW